MSSRTAPMLAQKTPLTVAENLPQAENTLFRCKKTLAVAKNSASNRCKKHPLATVAKKNLGVTVEKNPGYRRKKPEARLFHAISWRYLCSPILLWEALRAIAMLKKMFLTCILWISSNCPAAQVLWFWFGCNFDSSFTWGVVIPFCACRRPSMSHESCA